MKGQVAQEYLIIISVAMLILIPVIYHANNMLISYRDENKISSAKNSVNKLGETANWVFSQGPPARLTVEIYIPKDVENISLDNKTINFEVRTSSGLTDVFYETIAELDGSIPETNGYYRVAVVAHENYVNISTE